MNKLFAVAISLLLSGCVADCNCAPNTIAIGTSRENVLKLCGKPYKINHTGNHEQLVYSLNRFIYIDDDKFTSEQWTD